MEKLIYIEAVSCKIEHEAMWRWDDMMFVSRYSDRYKSFDLVNLETATRWWQKYPEQDWVLRDWTEIQIGQYCLCPLKEESFTELKAGRKIETDLSEADIVGTEEIKDHEYWYLANFMKAKMIRGLKEDKEKISDYAYNIMIQHALKRAIESDHFATKQAGGTIQIITIVESKAMRKIAENNRFQLIPPEFNNSKVNNEFRGIYSQTWKRGYIEKKLQEVEDKLNDSVKLIRKYKQEKQKSLFMQPKKPTFQSQDVTPEHLSNPKIKITTPMPISSNGNNDDNNNDNWLLSLIKLFKEKPWIAFVLVVMGIYVIYLVGISKLKIPGVLEPLISEPKISDDPMVTVKLQCVWQSPGKLHKPIEAAIVKVTSKSGVNIPVIGKGTDSNGIVSFEMKKEDTVSVTIIHPNIQDSQRIIPSIEIFESDSVLKAQDYKVRRTDCHFYAK